MFTWLGQKVSYRPKTVIALWVILALVGAFGALLGFGQGNLLARMNSSESMIPGSESDKVLEVAGAAGQGENIVVLVENVSAEEAESELADFRAGVLDLPHVTSVNDPINVNNQFVAELDKQLKSAVEESIANNQTLIDAAVAAALESSRDVLSQARAFGGEQAERQAREAIISQATDQARTKISEKVTTEAKQRMAALQNPSDSFKNGQNFVAVVQLAPGHYPDTVADVDKSVTDLQTGLRTHHPDAKAGALSMTLAKDVILEQTAEDLVTGEIVGLPIALILLIIVFGGIIAAGLPLGSALVSIAIGLGMVWGLTFITNVDNFILNIVSLIGLALSIDYGLLIVSRYREEIAKRVTSSEDPLLQEHVIEAVQTTIASAGRTVAFSALTIAFAISGLMVMNAPMLRMIAIGGVIVTILAVTTAVTLVPALIVVSGKKLALPAKLSQVPVMRSLFKLVGDSASDRGAFSALARWVHRYPWPVMVTTLVILAVVAAPIFTVSLRSNFIEYLPSDSREKEVSAVIERDFPDFATPSGTILAETDEKSALPFVKQIETIPGVTQVHSPQVIDDGVLINFNVDSADPVGPAVTKVVQQIRDLDTSYPHYVGGAAALQMDFNASNRVDAPLALGIVALAVIVLLFFMTGSVVAPFTALIINGLSLLAGLGGGAFLFNNGYLGLPQTNGLETFVVASAIAFGFGLAMDYEVFLLARIKEFWDDGESNDLAVEHGLQRSGRIITSAAAIIVAVFIGFVFGDLIAVKQIGVVLAIIVIVDATIVRLLLVPATMTILGKWNWWAPRPLRKLHKRFGIKH
ncbi:MMPL family transporter [Arcanobacterium phocae]|uniref:MMPL family transporter n=1 Tax=Arcanobacterium phocae TaxID=131112 RepID=UPI001C0EE62B|nr:MMPL family transporter [Arcanobacterium phocae]